MPEQPRLRVRLTLLDCGTPNTGHPASAERRLARVLKRLKRDYGFRVVAVEDVTPTLPTPTSPIPNGGHQP